MASLAKRIYGINKYMYDKYSKKKSGGVLHISELNYTVTFHHLVLVLHINVLKLHCNFSSFSFKIFI
jgi:hypothetical protein